MKVTIPENQTSAILSALDFYIRVLIGQYDVFSDSQRMFLFYGNEQEEKRDVRKILMDLRDQIIPELHSLGITGNYGIYNRDRDIRAGEAYNIYQEIRYKRASFYHPEGGFSNSFDKPLWTGDDPYPRPSVSFAWNKGGGAVAVKAELCREQLQIVLDALEMYRNHIQRQYVKLFRYLSGSQKVQALAKELEDACQEKDALGKQEEGQQGKIEAAIRELRKNISEE